MVEEIIKKLENELSLDINSERQVVYILSRIRKLIEFEKSENKYPYLSFYTDLSLHSLIDRTGREPRHSILEEFIKIPTSTHRFGFHTDFSNDLNNFFSDHNLNQLSEDNLESFIFELGKVISDTPIKVVLDSIEYTILLKPPKNKDESGLRIVIPPYLK